MSNEQCACNGADCQCKTQVVVNPEPYPVILFPSLPAGAGGPPCIWCNAPTRRTGACFTCIACGSTTSC